MKILLISFPKAGTYMFAEAFKRLGFIPTHMHLGLHGYSKHDPSRIRQERWNSQMVSKTQMPFENAINLIKDNSFATGHISYSKTIKQHLSNFKILLIKRNREDCWKSLTQFYKETSRGQNPKRIQSKILLNQRCDSITKWDTQNNVFTIWYNEFIKYNIVKVQAMCLFFGVKLSKQEVNKLITDTLVTDTLTKSNKRRGNK